MFSSSIRGPSIVASSGGEQSRRWSRPELSRHCLSLICCSLLLLSSSSCGTTLGLLEPADLCKCLPLAPDAADYRHLAKHVPIPNIPPVEVDVNGMLTWKQDLAMPPDAPRTGRELQVYHVSQSFLQNASVNSEDCDVHMEISETPDKSAQRVVVETPVDSEYCSARLKVQSMLSQHGFRLDTQHGGELPQSIRVEVTGLAFEDFEHNRGSAQVATVWELHPAIVNPL
jgi:hypothetical protein